MLCNMYRFSSVFRLFLQNKLQENIELAPIKIKSSKSSGNCENHHQHTGKEPIPSVSEKPVKSLGRWYDGSLKDKEQTSSCSQWPGQH